MRASLSKNLQPLFSTVDLNICRPRVLTHALGSLIILSFISLSKLDFFFYFCKYLDTPFPTAVLAINRFGN